MNKNLILFIKWLLYPFVLLNSWFRQLFINKDEKQLKIIGTGCYLPKKQLSNYELLEFINIDELLIKYNKKK